MYGLIHNRTALVVSGDIITALSLGSYHLNKVQVDCLLPDK